MAKTWADPAELVGKDACDAQGDKVGSIESAWVSDQTGELEFVGVKSGTLFGTTHIVPARDATLDAEGAVVLPYGRERIESAPDFDVSARMTRTDEDRIHAHYRSQASPGAISGAPLSDESEVRMPLREEHLEVGKREVADEVVRLRKVVRTETEHVPIDLRREEIHVERMPASEASALGITDEPFVESETIMRSSHEEPVVERSQRVSGEVRAYKTVESEQQTISGDVRHEDFEVDRDVEGERRPRDRL